MGNQPQSTSSNNNMRGINKSRIPKRSKKLKFRKYKKSGVDAQKRVDNKQTALVNSLSKKVFKLQMSSYGKIQQNYQVLAEPLIPTATAPLCLDLTDFTCRRPEDPGAYQGARVYQHLAGAVLPTTPSNWSIAGNVDNFYWQNQNRDQPDTGAYLAMNCTYLVEVTGVNALDNTRIRFDVVSQRDVVAPPISADLGPNFNHYLPDTLVFMKHLAEPMEQTGNRINPIYFKKYFTKTVFINSTKTDTATKGTTANSMRFSFRLKPNKLCSQLITFPKVGGLSSNPLSPQPEIERGNFGPYNVSPHQPLWLIVSTDDRSALGDAVQVKIGRRVVWRDHVGSANL